MTSSQVDMIACPGIAPPAGLYSHVSRVHGLGLAFIAGQLALNPQGEIVGKGDFAAQMRQVFDNLFGALKAAGATFADVAKFTTFLTRDSDIPAFVETRKSLFAQIYPSGSYPPNTLVVVMSLVRPEFLIEVEATAVTGRT